MPDRKIAGFWPYRLRSFTLQDGALARAHGVRRVKHFSALTGRLAHTGRLAWIAAGLGSAALLSACTTVEGTNALISAETFEREVMTETLQGIGILPRENTKEALNAPRGPLVEPPDPNLLPPPSESMASLLPEDSDRPLLDPTGLSEEDLRMIRGAKVVDIDIGTGRALTPQEAQILTARLRDYRAHQFERTAQSDFPLEMPPLHLFTNVGGIDFVCLAENGELVALDDPLCPPAIREALLNNG